MSSSTTSNDFDLTDLAGLVDAAEHMTSAESELAALGALVDAAKHVTATKFQVPPSTINLMDFPAEVRENIIDFYLLGEVEDGTICKAIHFDSFNRKCCVWNWPTELIVCDKNEEEDLPHAMFPKWLPDLALTSHQIRGEVIVHMLKTTETVTLKFDKDMSVKIAPWMAKFLATFPNNEGFEAIKDLNFPHIHWYNYYEDVPADRSNEDVDLMLQCPNLTRVGLTFHALRIVKNSSPLTLDEFLDNWKLRPMLDCKSLKHVYIGGIMYRNLYVDGDDQLQTLREFGEWLRASFEERGQTVTVNLYPRIGAFRGWVNAEAL